MAVEASAQRLAAVLSHRPSGLITDIDGTISAIAPTPEAARVSASVSDCLRELCARLDLVAAISGRAAVDARRMVGVAEMTYIGNHGLEVWQDGKTRVLPVVQPYVPWIAEALAVVRQATRDIKGIIYEDKGATASVHYRLAEQPEKAREAILAALAGLPRARDLRVTEGRMVVELRPPLAVNKGTALVSLLDQYSLAGAIYLGDDTTDVDAFRALHEWAQVPGRWALAVGVMADETPEAVRREADLTVAGVPAVEGLLRNLVDILRS